VDDDITAVIKAADQAVYNAKATGREQGINFSMIIRAPLLHFWSQNGSLIVVKHKAFQGNLLGPVKLTEFETVDGQPAQIPSLTAMVDDLQTQLSSREQQLGVLENLILTRELNKQVYPEGRPVQEGWISSYFGRRSDPFTGFSAVHKGVDFAGPEGTVVSSVAAGLVTFAGERAGFGQMVEINHGNGLATRYCHNEKLLVKQGDMVRKGQDVSLMGSTGHSTGPHLHFEVLKNGSQVDPLRFIGEER